MINPTSTSKPTTTQIDPEVVARRVNGAVAADRQAIEIRERYRQLAAEPDPQAIFRRLEAIEAAIWWLHSHIEESAS